MIYRLPELRDKDIMTEYVSEFCSNGESSMSEGTEFSSSDFTEWVEKHKTNAVSGDKLFGKSLLYLCFDEDKLIGLLNIRYSLPLTLSEKYGDIGYEVRPSEREKGYATEMLKYALTVCKNKKMNSVILGCYKKNTASAATIKKCGGVLFAENDNYTGGVISQYFTIEL